MSEKNELYKSRIKRGKENRKLGGYNKYYKDKKNFK